MKISIVYILQQCKHWEPAMGSAWQGTNPVKLDSA